MDDSTAAADGPPFWWCLRHQRVEGRSGCPNTERMGPYDTYAEAEGAIEAAHRRSEEWDRDPRWNDDVEP